MQPMNTRSNFRIVPPAVKQDIASFLPLSDVSRLKRVSTNFKSIADCSYFSRLNPIAAGQGARVEDSFDVFCDNRGFFERRRTEYLTFGPMAKAEIRNFFHQNGTMIIDLKNHTITLRNPVTMNTLVRHNASFYPMIDRTHKDFEYEFLTYLDSVDNKIYLRLSIDDIKIVGLQNSLFSAQDLLGFFLNVLPNPDVIKILLTGIPSLATRQSNCLMQSIPHAPFAAIEAFFLGMRRISLTCYLNFQDHKQNNDSALIVAAKHGRLDVVKLFLQVPGIDKELKNNEGKTAEMAAVDAGFLAVAQYIQSTEVPCPEF